MFTLALRPTECCTTLLSRALFSSPMLLASMHTSSSILSWHNNILVYSETVNSTILHISFSMCRIVLVHPPMMLTPSGEIWQPVRLSAPLASAPLLDQHMDMQMLGGIADPVHHKCTACKHAKTCTSCTCICSPQLC